MRVQVRLFARLREQAGTGRVEVELPAGATLRELHQELRDRFPALEADLRLLRPAVNQEYAVWDDLLRDGDEVALIPPVSGGGGPELLHLTTDPIDPRELERLVAHPGAGAICTFSGIVRDNSRGEAVTHLEYEAFAEMALAQMREILTEIAERWPTARAAMTHRTGRLEIGEASVVVSVSAPHRAEAIAACKWGIDRLKESVPIWKKEYAATGAVWIEGDGSPPDRKPG